MPRRHTCLLCRPRPSRPFAGPPTGPTPVVANPNQPHAFYSTVTLDAAVPIDWTVTDDDADYPTIPTPRGTAPWPTSTPATWPRLLSYQPRRNGTCHRDGCTTTIRPYRCLLPPSLRRWSLLRPLRKKLNNLAKMLLRPVMPACKPPFRSGTKKSLNKFVRVTHFWPRKLGFCNDPSSTNNFQQLSTTFMQKVVLLNFFATIWTEN